MAKVDLPGGPFHTWADQSILHHPGVQERPDEFQQPFVFDTLGDLCHQFVVINSIEKLLQIEINHPAVAFGNVPLCLRYSLMRRSSRSKTVTVIASAAPAASFKRPYRKCRGSYISARSVVGRRGTPDKDLTLHRTDQERVDK